MILLRVAAISIALLITLLVACDTEKARCPLQISRLTENKMLDEILPNKTHYILSLNDQALGVVSLNADKSMAGMLLINSVNGRTVNIIGVDGLFPCACSVNVLRTPPSKGQSKSTVFDDDLDGIPDRLMDWEKGTLYKIDDVKWSPVKSVLHRRSLLGSAYEFILNQASTLTILRTKTTTHPSSNPSKKEEKNEYRK